MLRRPSEGWEGWVQDIFAFGQGEELEYPSDGPSTPERASESAHPDLRMTHNFPVYAEGLSASSNGVSLIYREP